MLTAEQLRSHLNYDPATGEFTWIRPTGKRVKRGYRAGTVKKNVIVRIRVMGKIHRAHRLAWLFMTGSWPIGEIDHCDGDPSNNRWSNLRDVSHSVNLQNRHRKPRWSKRDLPMGVYARGERYCGRIVTFGKSMHIGTFDTPEEAHKAYIEAKRKYHSLPVCWVLT